MSASLLLVAHIRSADHEKLIQRADQTIKGTRQVIAIALPPSSNTVDESHIPRMIQNGGLVKVAYTSLEYGILALAYYEDRQLIAIDVLAHSGVVFRRSIFDSGEHLRVQMFFSQTGEIAAKDYFDDHGKRIDQYTYLPAFTQGGIY
jgi:hypothetical protein